MNNLIFVPYAYNKMLKTGSNIKKSKKQIDTYLKNVCVACISAKYYNPDDSVALVTNMNKDEIEKEFLQLLEKAGVKILYYAFDRFCFPNETPWGLCFYKLCALSHVLELDYENYCYLDSDVVIQDKFSYIWEETKSSILLYDMSHGLQAGDYRRFCDEVKIYNIDNPNISFITQYGGEFFAANKGNATIFKNELELIYANMVENGISTTMGDEYLLSIAANNINNKIQIKNASPYIERYWTSGGFRLVKTNYEENRVLILHLPNEKENGILKLYRDYISKGKMFKRNKVWSICRLSSYPLIDRAKHVIRCKQRKVKESKIT